MAPKTVQALIEDKFAALAEAAGLEFVTSGEHWLVMDTSDGLDTRLRIKRTFESAYLWVEMTGQAVERPDVNFFRERQLVRANAGASNRARLAVTVRAAYDKGDQLAKVFNAVRDMLAPFAAKPDSPVQAAAGARVVEATRSSWKDDDPAAARFVLTIPSGPGGRERRTLDPATTEDAERWAGQALGNMAVGRELILAALAEGWARAKVGGAYSTMLHEPDEDVTPLLLWVHGQDGPGVALTAEVLFAGEARLDALSTPVPSPAGLEPIRAALAAGVITEARVTDAAGTVIFDSTQREG